MQHFSNYFVQILVIRFKVQGGTNGSGGRRKIPGGHGLRQQGAERGRAAPEFSYMVQI